MICTALQEYRLIHACVICRSDSYSARSCGRLLPRRVLVFSRDISLYNATNPEGISSIESQYASALFFSSEGLTCLLLLIQLAQASCGTVCIFSAFCVIVLIETLSILLLIFADKVSFLVSLWRRL